MSQTKQEGYGFLTACEYQRRDSNRQRKAYWEKTGIDVLTLALRIHSSSNGFAVCSNVSTINVNGDALSRKLRSFEISRRLCVRRWDRLFGAMADMNTAHS